MSSSTTSSVSSIIFPEPPNVPDSSTVDAVPSHDDLLIRATLSHHCERWDDLLDVMKQLVEQSTSPLTFHERCLFSLACKRVIAPLRASWRLLITRETLLLSPFPPPSPPRELPLLSAYRLSLQSDLLARLDELILLVTSHLLPPLHPKLHRELQLLTMDLISRYSGRPLQPHAGTGEEGGGSGGSEAVEDEIHHFLVGLNAKVAFVPSLTQRDTATSTAPPVPAAVPGTTAPASAEVSAASSLIFYCKMLGDLRRYQSELSPSSERTRTLHSLHAHVSYSLAASLAGLLQLPPHSPEVLALALNRSVFEYEVMMQPERAMRIAKEAHDRAVEGEGDRGEGAGVEGREGEEEEGEGEEGDKGDSAVLKQQLKQNLTLWSSLT